MKVEAKKNFVIGTQINKKTIKIKSEVKTLIIKESKDKKGYHITD